MLRTEKEETNHFVKLKVSVKTQDKFMSYDQIKQIYAKLLNDKGYDKNDIGIMGLSKNGIFSLKKINQNFDNIENNEYWQNKNTIAQNLLDDFYAVEFMILK